MRAVVIIGLGTSLLLVPSLPLRASQFFQTPRDAVSACEKSAFGPDGNQTDEYYQLNDTERLKLFSKTFDCDGILREIESNFCRFDRRPSHETIRRAILDAGSYPALRRLPLEVFI